MKNATLSLAVDSRGGMAFNHRRQAKDTELISGLVRRFGGGGIFISPYSARLFESFGGVAVCNDPVSECVGGSLCFVESPSLLHDVHDNFSKIVLYCFGIPYPADEYFTLDLRELGYRRISKEKLKTYLHDRLTCEVWVREEN